ncbi:MAG TPA: M50 family metallopeptidase [candidate division Zixibacteria bacterium]|nr:M50 family metallopeptidase [candidate division Zixibacteria bacterium]
MITLLSFILVLGVLIFVHELGHFTVAKWVGIRVEKFSLGFPPNIFAKKKGDTTYCIGIIPLGGFVKMAGENPDDPTTGASDEFQSKSVGRRAAVIFAGPFMNYLAAIGFMIALVLVGGSLVNDPRGVAIGELRKDGPAKLGGLETGDVVIAIDGYRVYDFDSLRVRINAKLAEPLDLTWLRGNDTLSATMTTAVDSVKGGPEGTQAVGIIGFAPLRETPPLGAAIVDGFKLTHEVVVLTANFVKNLITGRESVKQLGGPVFIASQAGEAARSGAASLLWLLGILSINLAVLNVLPIPILDGAHLVFLAIEKIKGGPVPIKARAWAQQVGLVLILTLLVFVTYNDIVRVFTRN